MASFFSIVVPLKALALATTDYVLSPVGRVADEQETHLKGEGPLTRGVTADRVIFRWEDITDVEFDRIKFTCGLHGYSLDVHSQIAIKDASDLEAFFETYSKGEAPAVERPRKLSKAVIDQIRTEIKQAVSEAATQIAAAKPIPTPVEFEAPKPNYRINFFGWCSEEGHDKVWGYVTVGDPGSGELYNFWGKRGKRLAFQKHEGRWGSDELQKRADQKVRHGRSSGQYRQVAVVNIENVVPGFFDDRGRSMIPHGSPTSTARATK